MIPYTITQLKVNSQSKSKRMKFLKMAKTKLIKQMTLAIKGNFNFLQRIRKSPEVTVVENKEANTYKVNLIHFED